MDPELLKVMRFVFNDPDERSKETFLEKWGEAQTYGENFTLNDCVQIKENRIRLLQNMLTYKEKERNLRGGRGGGG